MREGIVTAFLAGGLMVCAGVALVGDLVPSVRRDAVTLPLRGMTPFQRANVEWLLEHRLPCLGCHVIDGRGGRLGPDLTDVGRRLDADTIAAHITSPGTRVAASTMPPVPMPARWQSLLVGYLAGGEGHQTPATVADNVPGTRHPSSDGQTLYSTLCAGCHGGTGRGDGPNASYLPVRPARLADGAVMGTRSDDWLFDMVARGGYVMNRHPYMPPYVDLLSPAEIRNVVGYLRQLCRCAAPSWGHHDGR